MKIIDRLPFADRPHLVTVQGEAVDVYRNQIILWISIDDVLKPLPAILDTGHWAQPLHRCRPAQEVVRCLPERRSSAYSRSAIGRSSSTQSGCSSIETCQGRRPSEVTPIRWRCHRESPSSRTEMHRAYR